MHQLSAVCLFAATAVGLPSQATWLVGPGGLPQIRDAIQAAAPGDVVVVQPGSYWNFTLAKGLTIRAAVPGTVEVGFDAATPLLGYTVFAAPAGQPVDVVGVRFAASVLSFPIVHRVQVTSGRVRFDGCELRARGEVLNIDDAEVLLQACTVEEVDPFALGAVIRSNDSVVGIVDSQVLGATNASFAFGGSLSAIELFGGSLHVSGSLVRGSVLTGLGGTAAIGGLTTSSAWVVDSTLEGVAGACALLIPVQVGRTTLVGVGCGWNAQPLPDPVGVSRPQPPTVGASFAVDFKTGANGFVGVLASADVVANGVPLTVQPGMLDPATMSVAGLVLTDANGDGGIQWQIPNNPALQHVGLWLQGVGGTALTLPLQASPVVGGVVR